MFSIAEDQDVYSGLGVLMNYEDYAAKDYRVNFIYGFAGTHTGYFVTTHPNTAQPPYTEYNEVTYISQICLKNSYRMGSCMELPLECRKDGIVYKEAIAASTNKVDRRYAEQLIFKDSKQAGECCYDIIQTTKPSQERGLCVPTARSGTKVRATCTRLSDEKSDI
ncbi:uncharacterized protein LOC144747200 [Ciona intestinalis]